MSSFLAIFVIAAIGYLIGGIKIRGVELGTAGVLLAALVFGHFGVEIPSVVRNFGLATFVASVGFMAGPKFFRDFKKNAKNYILLGVLIIFSGALSCVAVVKLSGIQPELGVGLLTGALTSTPGLAAAQEAAGALAPLAATGYAIAYPFGVVSKVLFVQLVPKMLRADMAAEREKFARANSVEIRPYAGKRVNIDGAGFFAFTLAVALGIALGNVRVPLPGGAEFSLGTAGGPLIVSLLFGHFAHLGPADLSVSKPMLKVLRELGLMLFLVGAGVQGGAGFVKTLQTEGAMLFVHGAAMTVAPMVVGYVVATKLLRMSLLNSLGAITGGMTSTPALGALIDVAGTDDVASAYAATYPIALACVVLSAQFIVMLMR